MTLIPMSPEEELWIRATVLADERGLEAWRQVRRGFDIERVSAETYLLLPLLYRNLSGLGAEEELLPKLKSVYRHTWAGNQLLFRALADLLEALETAGIPTLVLKGAALVLNYYQDLGARRMSDFDVLVPAAARPKALDLLDGLGWSGPDERIRNLSVHYHHAIEFRSPDRRNVCDLHWQVMNCLGLADDPDHSTHDFWVAADPTEILGVRSRVLGPADLLLHACVHGLRDDHVRLLWVADALQILASSGERLDWDRLVGQASKRGAILPLRRALRLLVELDASVPATVIQELGRLPVTRRQAYPYGSFSRFIGRYTDETLLGSGASLFDMYARISANWTVTRTIRELPTFLQMTWGLGHQREVPLHMLRKVRRKLAVARS